MRTDANTIWVLLWSKYSADQGMYPYHIETLAEYLRDGWQHHNTWRDARTRTHNNLWILLYQGELVDVETCLMGLVKQHQYAGADRVMTEVVI